MDREKMQKNLPFVLPEWFSFERYQQAKHFQAWNWASSLYERQRLNCKINFLIDTNTLEKKAENCIKEIEEYTDPKHKSMHLQIATENTSTPHPFFEGHPNEPLFYNPVREAFLEEILDSYNTIEESIEFDSLRRITNSSKTTGAAEILATSYMIIDKLPQKKELQALISSIDQLTQIKDPPSNDLPTYTFHNREILAIDLMCTNEQLLTSFKETIERLREKTGININTKESKNKFTESDFNKWCRYRVLEYIDLQLISKIHQKDIPHEQMRQVFFGNDIDMESRIKKTLPKLSHNLLQEATIQALYYQSDSENRK